MFASFVLKNSTLPYYMTPNVLEPYDEKKIHIFDPIEQDGDYFSKIMYEDQPLIVQVECLSKAGRIFLNEKSSLEWFDQFYSGIIAHFHKVSADWFEEPLTLRELESSFLSPLKANIKEDCFELLCKVDEDIVEPCFYIKGIQFNNKHFFLEICTEPIKPKEPKEAELDEYIVDTDELPNADIHLDKLSIFKVYEFLNTKIKNSMSEEIKRIFSDKKIKSRLDFLEVFDDEDHNSFS